MYKDTHKYGEYLTLNQETRWATTEEIKNAGTHLNLNDNKYATAGIPLMSTPNELYVDGTDTHTMIFGSTGSKKTRLFCMPLIHTCAKAGESFIVTDPKGELYERTAGYVKQQGHNIVVLNFRDIGMGDCWNPLALPYQFYHSKVRGDRDKAISMINDFVSLLISPDKNKVVDFFWPQMSTAYLIACALFLMECGDKDNINLSSLAHMCTYESARILDSFAQNMDESSTAGINFKNVFSAAGRTKRSILVSTYAYVANFNSQKRLASLLSQNTINFNKIGREKTAIYLIIPDEKTTLHFLAATFIKQVYEALISEAQKEKNCQLPVRVNFLLDEFCNMPVIPDMPAMISAARSRNIRYFLIAQSKHQLLDKYSESAETIKGNCDNWVFLTSKELTLLNEISELCGEYLEPRGNKRRLISVSELQRLDKQKGEALIMHGRQYPFITELTDVDSYIDFKKMTPPKLKEFTVQDVKHIRLDGLKLLVKAGRMPIPFGKPNNTVFVDKYQEDWGN